MTDIAVDFVKKIFSRYKEPEVTINGTTIKTGTRSLLQVEVDNEQSILENKIKLKAIKSITDEQLDKAFKELKIDEIITSSILLKVAESVKRQSTSIVREALEDLDENYEIKRAIKSQVVNTIKNAFKI